jgi:GGDEF domain-containing protein
MSTVDALVQLIFNVYEAFTVAIYLRQGDVLSCLSSVSFSRSFDRLRKIPVETSLPGWVVKHNEPLIIPNFDKDESTLGYYGSPEEIKSFMGYPLDVPGLIVIDSKKKYVFTDKEKKILAHFVAIMHDEVEREKRLQEVEELNEEMLVERRIIDYFRHAGSRKDSEEEVLRECLTLSGSDLCFIALEQDGNLVVTQAVGREGQSIVRKKGPMRGSVASMVIERGLESLLPYKSGYLRDRPILFEDDDLQATQFFGFPLVIDDVAYGLLGMVSLSDTSLREKSIGVLRDISLLLSLFLAASWLKRDRRRSRDLDPVTGAFRYSTFCKKVEEWAKKGERFSVVSVKIPKIEEYNRVAGVDFTDKLFQIVYKSIEYCIGRQAIITRSAGGQFFAAVEGMDPSDINNVLKILNYTITSSMPEGNQTVMRLAQTGLAHCPQDGQDVWQLLERAENRMKRAK